MERWRNRCETGILRAEDMSGRALSGPMPERDIHHADRGGWQEAIGLFCLGGNFDGVDEAYDRAFEVYEAAGDPHSHRAETPKTTLYTRISPWTTCSWVGSTARPTTTRTASST
jgi:hypothetical protein